MYDFKPGRIGRVLDGTRDWVDRVFNENIRSFVGLKKLILTGYELRVCDDRGTQALVVRSCSWRGWSQQIVLATNDQVTENFQKRAETRDLKLELSGGVLIDVGKNPNLQWELVFR